MPPSPIAPVSDDDTTLLTRAVAGDRAAVEMLYRRHEPAARWVAERWASTAHDVDDLVADSFARVLRALPGMDPEQVIFRRYLLACVRNAAHDRARRPPRVEYYADVPDSSASVPFDETPLTGCEAVLMSDALQALPDRWREVLWLTAVEGRTVSEVAHRRDSTPGAVAAIAYRARRRLRAAYLSAHAAAGNTGQPGDCPVCRAGQNADRAAS